MILKSKEETTRSDKDTIIKYTSDNFLCIFTDHSHIGSLKSTLIHVPFWKFVLFDINLLNNVIFVFIDFENTATPFSRVIDSLRYKL